MNKGLHINLHQKINLLLIEDNFHDAMQFHEYIRGNYSEEFEIIHSPDLKSGIEKISSQPFDIIVTDLNLPESSGLDTLNALKKNSADIPIVIFSGLSETEMTIEAIQNGAQDYVYKGSFNGDFIYRVIRYAIERKRFIAEIEEKTSRLIELNNNLREININKDRMYSIISHDLLSPINVLKGYSSLLNENYEDLSEVDRKQSVAAVDGLLSEVTELLKELLTWAAVNTGRIDFNPQPADLGSILRKQIHFLKPAAENKNINIVDETIELPVMADKIMIETAVRNLISNAVKFTKPGGKIFVKNFAEDKHAVIIVEDTGIGMERQEIDKLFKTEENISKTGTNMEKGIGLGLLICKEFIYRHDGTIEVLSKKNVGSSFIIRFPNTL